MGAIKKFFAEKFFPNLAKIGENKVILSVRDGVAMTIPFTIAGSIFMVLAFLPIPGWEAIIKPYQDVLLVPVSVTFDILSIIVAAGVGYSASKRFNQDKMSGTILSIIGFLLLQYKMGEGIQLANFGSKGIFVAILVALFSVFVLKFFVEKNIVIKLPDTVPPAISNSFVSLIPSTFVILFLWVIHIILGIDVTNLVTKMFSPLVFALNTLPGITIYVLFTLLLWTVGIHGASIMSGVGDPILLSFMAANAEAFVAGKPIPYIVTHSFTNAFIYLGAEGTIVLAFLMLRSKEKGFRELGKLSIIPAIFQINEPIIFGVPIVFNPLMSIPYVLTPVVFTILTYILTYFGIISKTVAMMPWTTPPLVGAYLSTAGDWRAVIWTAIELVIGFFIYLPFFKKLERQRLAASQEN